MAPSAINTPSLTIGFSAAQSCSHPCKAGIRFLSTRREYPDFFIGPAIYSFPVLNLCRNTELRTKVFHSESVTVSIQAPFLGHAFNTHESFSWHNHQVLRLCLTHFFLRWEIFGTKVIGKFKTHVLQGGSNMTGTDVCVNKPHCAEAVRPRESEATTSTLPRARVRTCSVLSGSC